MAPMIDDALFRRGRWMYELGRARWASRSLLLVLPLLVVAWLVGRPGTLILALGGTLAATAFGFAMAHDRYARAVRIGVLGGLPALLIPVLARVLHLVPLGAGVDPCVPASFLSGVAAGWVVSRRTAEEAQRLAFWTVAVFATALTGSLGCTVAGGSGVVGLMAGVVAGSAPVLLRTAMQRG
jgi:hypothetical protein